MDDKQLMRSFNIFERAAAEPHVVPLIDSDYHIVVEHFPPSPLNGGLAARMRIMDRTQLVESVLLTADERDALAAALQNRPMP